MKLCLSLLLIFFIGAGAVLSASQAPSKPKSQSPLEQVLTAAEKSFIAAARKPDADYFQRTLTNDYLFIGYDGQEHDREEVLGDRSSDAMELQPYNMKVLELGEAAAIVTYDVILHVPPEEDQGPPPRYQHWTSVWTRQGDQWKLKFQQSTPTHWGDW